MKHEEATLHLTFCKWVKKNYPADEFIRHEREGHRSLYMQNLFKVYNTDNDKMPDFECLEPSLMLFSYDNTYYHRLYIEFKAPGTKLTLKDNINIKKEYAAQYKRHITFWNKNSCAYFCNDLELAKELYIAYKSGNPLPMQVFEFPADANSLLADKFFNEQGIG